MLDMIRTPFCTIWKLVARAEIANTSLLSGKSLRRHT